MATAAGVAVDYAMYDVMKSMATSLRVAYGRRARAASTTEEREHWRAKRLGVRDIVAGAVDTDREDMIARTKMMRDEFDRIGGLSDGGRV
ncbi:hypothetical protein [Corynebacterium bovis]|uniref:hypothetical protein n=1 Tax=Corynebacterium bovis TaxID=36808 RepID=UPI000F64B3A7|nr:hypothetical protein [Corynebacterium bovis]